MPTFRRLVSGTIIHAVIGLHLLSLCSPPSRFLGANWSLCHPPPIDNKDEFYSECIPKKLGPWPVPPASAWCGAEGKTANAGFGGAVSALDIAIIWKHATEGLTSGHLPGGASTCVAAVTVALGECGHPAQSEWRTIDDKVCTKDASGAGGLWQVTSQDGDDTMLAGCTDGFDFCCNARIACERTLAPAPAAPTVSVTLRPKGARMQGCIRLCTEHLFVLHGQEPKTVRKGFGMPR